MGGSPRAAQQSVPSTRGRDEMRTRMGMARFLVLGLLLTYAAGSWLYATENPLRVIADLDTLL